MIDKDVQELEEAKAALGILSRLPDNEPVPIHVAAIMASMARWAEALDRGL